MKKQRLFVLSVLCTLFLLNPFQFSFFTDTNPQVDSPSQAFEKQDTLVTPDISKLTWELTPDTHISTFQEYQKQHPYTPAMFFNPLDQPFPSFSTQSTFSILVSHNLYSSISANLMQYKTDLEERGFSVFIDTVKGGTPEEIKNWVKSRYQAGSTGVLFIGDIPAAWAEVSEAQFPCDLFYMDLDGKWTDANSDGVYESHSSGSGDMGPELFVGRLYATTLTWDTEASMINEYLSKAHAYRMGNLTVPWRGLEYVDEDWYTMDIFLDDIYFDNVTRCDYGYRTTASDYLEKLSEGQHFVTVCAHSYPGGHHFGTRPTEAVSYGHVYVFSPTEREAKLLLGCDDGIKVWLNGENVFTKDVYMGYRADQYRVDVTLQKGWNSLLCKISQEGGSYQFSARFTDTDFQTFTDLLYQTSNPETSTETEPEFIRSWLVNGFHQDSSDRFWQYLSTNYLSTNEATVVPVEGEEMGGKIWTVVNSPGPYIDLDSFSNAADFGVSYAFVKVIASEEIHCMLCLGYDDGIRGWLNGECIIDDNRYGGIEYDMTTVNVTLHAGENTLLLKISEWMGASGFAARFCTMDGGKIEGLRFDPAAQPITYISSWLINGVYENPDAQSRLSIDYLDGEATVRPSEGDSATEGTWVKGIGGGRPFDLGLFFDDGDWVFSETIQEQDPPVLFYNLFSCGPGRFTDENYLAGSYIFHTSYGLCTIASAKSGSMLNFQDFYTPLGAGKTIGESFMEWFDAQAPFVQWEKEWYYGMVLNGDPLLTLFVNASSTPSVTITSPEDAIYINNSRVFPFFVPLVFGPTLIQVKVTNPGAGVRDVSFYVDGDLVSTDSTFPFMYSFSEKRFGRVTVDVVVTDSVGQQGSDTIILWKFF